MAELLPTSSVFSSLFKVRQYPSKLHTKSPDRFIISTFVGIHIPALCVNVAHG